MMMLSILELVQNNKHRIILDRFRRWEAYSHLFFHMITLGKYFDLFRGHDKYIGMEESLWTFIVKIHTICIKI